MNGRISTKKLLQRSLLLCHPGSCWYLMVTIWKNPISLKLSPESLQSRCQSAEMWPRQADVLAGQAENDPEKDTEFLSAKSLGHVLCLNTWQEVSEKAVTLTTQEGCHYSSFYSPFSFSYFKQCWFLLILHIMFHVILALTNISDLGV